MKKLCLLILFVLLILGCSIESDGHDVNTSALITVKKICIEDHYYYYVPYSHKGGIAPVLTDDGKPIHCDISNYK